MYDLRNVWKQEPNAIRSAVLSVLGVFVLAGIIEVSKDVTIAVGIAVNAVLELFYVRPLTATKDSLRALDTRKK